MRRSFIVAFWEVRAYLQDKADLAFSLLLPIAIFALMYGAFGGQSTFNGTAHVVNEDMGGTYSAILIDQLLELEGLDVEVHSRTEADSKLARSDLLMVLYIPEGFSDALKSGESTNLTFKQRGNGGQSGQIVAAIVRGTAEKIHQELQIHNQVGAALTGAAITQSEIQVTIQKFLDRERLHPTVGVSEITLGSSPDPVRQFLPGIVTMFILFSITLSARAIVEERKKGTLERLLTTRLSVGQLFAGKFIANIFRGFIQTFILLILAYMMFQLFTPLSFLTALFVALIFSAAASALGLIIASVARSEDGATWIAVFFTMAMVMISGTFFPISEGTLMHTVSKFSLNTYAIDTFTTIIAQEGSLADTGLEIGVLAGVTLLGLSISRLLFRVTSRRTK